MRVEGEPIVMDVDIRGAGPPVLLLHGFTGTRRTWTEFASKLAADHRTIAPDLLGHGASSHPTEADAYAVERQARYVAALMDGAGPADVVGYSMGARFALRLAIDHPTVVRRLVLESPSAGIADAAERAERRAVDEELADRIERDGIEAFVDEWERLELFETQAALPRQMRDRIRRERLSQDPAGLADAVRGAGQGAMEPLHARLAEIAVPTLVVAGALDAVGLERARVVAGGIPGAHLEIVPGTGHAPHLEAPETFADLVIPFLAQRTCP